MISIPIFFSLVRCRLRCRGNLPVAMLSFPLQLLREGCDLVSYSPVHAGTRMGQSHTAFLFIFLRQCFTLWPRLGQSLLQPLACWCHRFVSSDLAADSLPRCQWYSLPSYTSPIFQEKIGFRVRVSMRMRRQAEQI